MAKGYHKLLSYKDEYEVARLHAATLQAAVDAQFTDVRAMRFHLAPPILGGTDASGRPKKREFGPWMMRGFDFLRRIKVPARHSARSLRLHRRAADGAGADRRVRDATWTPSRPASPPPPGTSPWSSPPSRCEIRGFGPVKMQAAEAAAARRAALRAAFAAGGRSKAARRGMTNARPRLRRRPAARRLRRRRPGRPPGGGAGRPLPGGPGRGGAHRAHLPRGRQRARWSAPPARWSRASTPPSSSPRRGWWCRTSARSRRSSPRPAPPASSAGPATVPDRHPLAAVPGLGLLGVAPAGPVWGPAGARLGRLDGRAIRSRTIPTSG